MLSAFEPHTPAASSFAWVHLAHVQHERKAQIPLRFALWATLLLLVVGVLRSALDTQSSVIGAPNGSKWLVAWLWLEAGTLFALLRYPEWFVRARGLWVLWAWWVFWVAVSTQFGLRAFWFLPVLVAVSVLAMDGVGRDQALVSRFKGSALALGSMWLAAAGAWWGARASRPWMPCFGAWAERWCWWWWAASGGI